MLRVLIAGLFFISVLAFGYAQNNTVENNKATLERVEGEIPVASEDDLVALREQVRSLRLDADKNVAPIRTRIAEVQAELARLEEALADEETESPDLISSRERLQGELNDLEAAASQSDLNITQANKLLIDIAERSREAFFGRTLEGYRSVLLRVADEIPEADEDALQALREEVRSVRLGADTEVAPIRTRIAEVQADLERIGEEPAEDVTEPPEIISLRAGLRKELEGLDAIASQADLNITEASRLLIDIANHRRDAFYERVLERDKPPFTPAAAKSVIEALKIDLGIFQGKYATWRSSLSGPGQFRATSIAFILAVFAAFVLLWPIPRWLDRSLLTTFKQSDPTPDRRASLAALRVVTRALPALVAAVLIYQVASANGMVTDNSARLFGSVLLALATIFVVDDVASAVFAPKEPAWRVISVESNRAVLVRLLLVLTVIVFSANAVLTRLSEWLESSRELVTVLSALLVVTGAILMFILARPRLWKPCEHRPVELTEEARIFWRWTRNLVSLLVVLSVLSVLVGYVALGRYVLTRIYYLSFLFAAAWFARALLLEAAQRLGSNIPAADGTTQQVQGQDRKEDQRLIVFWFQLLIDVLIFAVTLPIALTVLGVKWTDMRNWVIDIVVGIEIGGVTISLGKIFAAIAAIFIILLITRFVQRTVDTRIFAPARMEGGLRNTFRTLIGYFGLILGVMVAIGTLGFPLSNLAIVAGALSLGIGFGLQSIVNNFVSGLILLFERPIKVGDWIVTSAGEGIVKRISVRSTEIETFDWASVIVPNSELITLPVTNWTHKNRYTRLTISIGVSYDSDPEMVSEILLKAAKANRRTLSYPSPVIYFSGFGDSSLDFEVRIFINNVDDRIPVKNELRLEIFKQFKEAGIEIPYPQRDLHLRSLVPGMRMAGEPEPEEGEGEDEEISTDATPEEKP